MSAKRARGVLDEARGVRAMIWVIAIMLFLTVLAAALGIATRNAAMALERQLSGRLTIQIVGDEAAAARVTAALRAQPEVRRVAPVSRAELAKLLSPWLGADGADPDLPMPALIDVDLTGPDASVAARVAAAVRRVAPNARIDRQAAWMSPVSGVLRAITLLALTLVALMAGATAAVVVLAARAGLDAHRPTIEVMHMLGSTDVQVARLFQRRIARDAAIGGLIGGVAALAVVAFLGTRIAALGSDLLGGVTFGAGGWIALAALPLAFIALAALAARMAVTATMRRTL